MPIQNFRLNGGGVRGVLFSGYDARMEIAIGAFRLTERDLDVNAESHGGSHDFSTRHWTYYGSGTIFTCILRSRGPSYSHRKMPCHRPRARWPRSIKTI